MKTLKRQLILVLSLLFLISFNACDQSNQNKKSQDKTKLEKKISDIKTNIKKEREKIEAELNRTVKEFDDKIAVLEDDLEKTGGKLDDTKKNILMNLKAQRDSIKAEAQTVKNVSKENWNDFKNKVSKETKDFNKSVKDFFDTENDNK